jgi:hypothetical protein
MYKLFSRKRGRNMRKFYARSMVEGAPLGNQNAAGRHGGNKVSAVRVVTTDLPRLAGHNFGKTATIYRKNTMKTHTNITKSSRGRLVKALGNKVQSGKWGVQTGGTASLYSKR